MDKECRNKQCLSFAFKPGMVHDDATTLCMMRKRKMDTDTARACVGDTSASVAAYTM